MGSKQYKTNSYTEFFYKAFRNILIVSIPILVISALILSLPHSSASTDQIEFSLSVSCTMSSIVNTAHAKEITNGTYHSDVGKTTITALCNDGNGYTVYATGYSNNEVGNNKLINTTNSQYGIDTGLATSGLTSTWAMKLNNLKNDPSSTPPIIESAYDDTYGLVPNNWTKVASRPSGTTDMNLGSSFTTTYSVYTSSSQFAGTYRGQVKYALLHPYSNTVSFNSFDQAFAFYEKEKVTVIDPITGNTGSYYKMQDMDSDICSLTNVYGEASAAQLVDIRDNKLYWIAKLADNNCWMTNNLDLDIGGVNTTPLNSNNTDISTDPSVYGTNGIYSDYSVSNGVYTWNPDSTAITSGRTITYPNNTNNPTVSNWTNNDTEPYSAEGGDTYYYTSNSDSNDTRYTNLSQCTSAGHSGEDCKWYFAGNYYNWTAAVASNGSSNISATNARATNSICPKNWHLPNAYQTDNEYNEFGRLFYKADITSALSNNNNSITYKNGGFNKLRSDPYYFVRSGGILGGTLYDSGVYGNFWSSTVNSSTYAYSLNFNSTGLWPAISNYRNRGRSVRCVARSASE